MRTDLAVDYAKVFLAAGIPQGGAAFPYESVYTSPDGLVMQEARDEVVRLYRAKGLGVEGAVEPEDHIAFEFEFLVRLCCEGREAAQAGDAKALEASIEEQRAFLATHVLNWVPRFCEDVVRYANTEFYRAIALMTAGFAAMDAEVLDQMGGRAMISQISRRSFCVAAGVSATLVALGGAGALTAQGAMLRPPGGQDERAFVAGCTHCGRCVERMPCAGYRSGFACGRIAGGAHAGDALQPGLLRLLRRLRARNAPPGPCVLSTWRRLRRATWTPAASARPA